MKEPQLGAHLVSSRTLYSHHGIYVGDGKVIHYAGLADGFKRGPVEETSLSTFAGDHGWSEKIHADAKFIGAEAVARAVSRIGEKLYSVTSCNCEHFAEWVVTGRHLSHQADAGAAASPGLVGALAGKAAIMGIGAAAVSTVPVGSGPAVMSGLAAAGKVLIGGAAAGVGVVAAAPAVVAAAITNKTLLKDVPTLDDDERDARAAGRKATVAGAAAGTAGAVAAVAAVGVPGLSAIGISSGLAGVGATVGGGMVAGLALTAAAPAAVAVGVGYGVYKLVSRAKRDVTDEPGDDQSSEQTT